MYILKFSSDYVIFLLKTLGSQKEIPDPKYGVQQWFSNCSMHQNSWRACLNIAGPNSQFFLFTESGVGPRNLHFQQVPK